MELCNGGSLDKYIKKNPFSESLARKCLSQIGLKKILVFYDLLFI